MEDLGQQLQHMLSDPQSLQQLQGLLPIVTVVHAVGQPPQAADDGLAQGAFIFNDQKVHKSPPFHFHVVLNYSKNR